MIAVAAYIADFAIVTTIALITISSFRALRGRSARRGVVTALIARLFAGSGGSLRHTRHIARRYGLQLTSGHQKPQAGSRHGRRSERTPSRSFPQGPAGVTPPARRPVAFMDRVQFDWPEPRRSRR